MAKRGCSLALALIWLLSLLGSTTPAIATPDVVEWSRVNIPTEGKVGNWVLADGLDVQHLTMAIDGTLYAYGKGLTYTLYKSTNGGFSWAYTGKVKDNIVDIATAPDDASLLYYATSSNVYQSTDAGKSFTRLAANPGGAGSNHIEITSIDVTLLGNDYIIAVGTRDTDGLQYGGVYILDEAEPFAGWKDTNLGSYDVYEVVFSPNFASDQQMVAVVTDEVDTLVTTTIDGDGWGQTAGDAIIEGITPNSVAIAFPSDYDSDVTSGGYVQFMAIDAGGDCGDVYMIEGIEAPDLSVATDLNIGSDYGLSNVDVASLGVSGNSTSAYLLAGAANSAQVYYSTDGGTSWTTTSKLPTGEAKTYVLIAADFAQRGRAYAATSGTESAFSYTTDGGDTWNQVGLIDTGISNIVDLAVSSNYSQDNTLFMLTWGGEHSLWRSLNGGERWERLYSSTLDEVDSIDLVELSPEDDSQVVFLAGSNSGSPAIWKSTDNGQSFIHRSVPFPIDIWVWAVVNDKTLFIGSHDGSNGLVYRTTNSGLSYSTRTEVGNYQLYSIALSPDYDEDETILIGNTSGEVYWSQDNGVSFELLVEQPPELIANSDSNNITVAFDPDYSRNNLVYAASHCKKDDKNSSAIYRFIIGTSHSWKKIDSTLPDGAIVDQLIVSADGTLYAMNSQLVDTAKGEGGMERSLNPTYSLGPTFETVTRGLDDGATLTGLWLNHNQLWSIDTANWRVMTYTDSLTQPVIPTSPQDEAQGIGTIINHTISNVSLDWEAAEGATKYQWQLDYDTDFSIVPAGFEGSTKASQAKLPPLEPATTYYWRARVTEPVLSPWSTKWSFTTSLGSETIAPKLYSPEAGASGIELKPAFQWSAIAGADSYELLVSTDASLGNPLIVKVGDYALDTTAWQCDLSLNYNTTYYWKVRACSSDSYSAWSAVSAFTTKSPPAPTEPVQSPSQPSPPPPPPPAQQTTPNWVIYLMGLMGFIIILLLATILVLAIRRH